MRDLVYEYNGVIYKTKKEAPEGATVKLVDSPKDRAVYDASRIERLRHKLHTAWASATE